MENTPLKLITEQDFYDWFGKSKYKKDWQFGSPLNSPDLRQEAQLAADLAACQSCTIKQENERLKKAVEDWHSEVLRKEREVAVLKAANEELEAENGRLSSEIGLADEEIATFKARAEAAEKANKLLPTGEEMDWIDATIKRIISPIYKGTIWASILSKHTALRALQEQGFAQKLPLAQKARALHKKSGREANSCPN